MRRPIRNAALALALLTAHPHLAQPAALRILAATEMRLVPSLGADGVSLQIEVQLRDDRGQPVRGQSVRISAQEENVPRSPEQRVELTDERGFARATFWPAVTVHVLRVRAAFEGGGAMAGTQGELRVDMDDQAFASLSIEAPRLVDIDATSSGASFFEVHVQVQVALPRSPAGTEVGLLLDDRLIAGPSAADATGHVVFRVPASVGGEPGVRTLRARRLQRGISIDSSSVRIVFRARTTLVLHRDEADNGGTPRVVGALATSLGPVAHQPIQVCWGTRVVGAALTDPQGGFVTLLDPDIAGRPGVSVRATFSPSEPWYVESSSSLVEISQVEPRHVSGWLAAAPLLAALVVLGLSRLRRQRVQTVRSPVALRALGDAKVERIAGVSGSRVRAVISAVDGATAEIVGAAEIHWIRPPLGVRAAGEPTELVGGGRFQLEIQAPGYAPRMLESELPRGGEYAVQVPIRSWREELFDRARRWIRSTPSSPGAAMPTPREALDHAALAPAASELVSIVEYGAYGPEPPTARSVEAADRALSALDHSSTGER